MVDLGRAPGRRPRRAGRAGATGGGVRARFLPDRGARDPGAGGAARGLSVRGGRPVVSIAASLGRPARAAARGHDRAGAGVCPRARRRGPGSLADAVAVAGPSRAICVLDRRRGPGPVVVARPRGSCRRARAGLGWAGLSPLPHDDQLSQCSRDFRLCSRDDPPFRARRGYPRRGARIGGSSGRGGPRRRCPQRRGARGRRARGAGRGHDRGDHPGPVCRAAG